MTQGWRPPNARPAWCRVSAPVVQLGRISTDSVTAGFSHVFPSGRGTVVRSHPGARMNLENNMDQTNEVNVDQTLATAIRTIGEVTSDRDELRLDLRYAIDRIESLEEQLRTARNDLRAGRRG